MENPQTILRTKWGIHILGRESRDHALTRVPDNFVRIPHFVVCILRIVSKNQGMELFADSTHWILSWILRIEMPILCIEMQNLFPNLWMFYTLIDD